MGFVHPQNQEPISAAHNLAAVVSTLLFHAIMRCWTLLGTALQLLWAPDKTNKSASSQVSIYTIPFRPVAGGIKGVSRPPHHPPDLPGSLTGIQDD